jgi:hypothetical protein
MSSYIQNSYNFLLLLFHWCQSQPGSGRGWGARGKYQFFYSTDMYVSYTAHYKCWLSCGNTACLYQIPALDREEWSKGGPDHFIPQGESIKVNRVGPRPSQDSIYVGNKNSIQVLQPTAYLLHSTYKYTHAQ